MPKEPKEKPFRITKRQRQMFADRVATKTTKSVAGKDGRTIYSKMNYVDAVKISEKSRKKNVLVSPYKPGKQKKNKLLVKEITPLADGDVDDDDYDYTDYGDDLSQLSGSYMRQKTYREKMQETADEWETSKDDIYNNYIKSMAEGLPRGEVTEMRDNSCCPSCAKNGFAVVSEVNLFFVFGKRILFVNNCLR